MSKKLDLNEIQNKNINAMNFESTLKSIIEDNFLLQSKDTPFLNEQTVQFKIAVELFKRLNIEVQLEKCFNPFDNKKDYLDIFYDKDEIGIELKYKLKGIRGFPFANQSAQNLGNYGFFKDIYRLENLLFHDYIKIGYAVIITNDKLYTQDRKGNVADFSITPNNHIEKDRQYIVSPNEYYIFKQNYNPFSWIEKQNKDENICQFYVCIQKIEKV